MNEHDTTRIAHNAADVLNNEAYKNAMQSLQEQMIEALIACPAKDDEGRLIYQLSVQVARTFEHTLRGMIEGGKLAQAKIDLDNLRDENGARKLMRRVL